VPGMRTHNAVLCGGPAPTVFVALRFWPVRSSYGLGLIAHPLRGYIPGSLL